MGQTHGCSPHPSSRYLELCAGGWDGDINFLGFDLILIYELEQIRYLMTSNNYVRNMSAIISSFYDIVEKCFTESAVTGNMMCGMRSCRMCNWI